MKVILVGEMEQKEPEIAVVGTKGQIVIPQQLRRELKIAPKTKLAVYRKGDKLVVTKLKVPPLGEELRSLFKEIDEKYEGKKRPTEKEILEEIQAYRREKRAEQGASNGSRSC
ncbi:MAG: AbrB/MazE/SpoVT family DNA-binding domain-containing protein [Nitrososphaerales archaeon]|nr:AbrB/MazE/SpoVT family DNA-binding domain-containing protein [Nitrososphaerales archaeon]